MNTSQALGILYKIMNERFGEVEAKESVSTAIYNVISDLQEQGLEVTSEGIERRLIEYVNDYVQASQKNQVA
jgi:hypothetical protein